jgi:hypothetical protein
MKFLIFIAIILGCAYAWFSLYEPTPQGRTMQGTMNTFMTAINDRNLGGMRAMCAPDAQDDCGRILETIVDHEERYRTTLSAVGSIGFDYTRGRTTVDGLVSATSVDGDTLWSGNIQVQQIPGSEDWHITVIR